MTAVGSQLSVRLLGVDGGGTATEAWLAAPGGHVLGRGTAGPSNAKAVGPEAARRAIDAAITAAFHAAGISRAPVDVVCFGLAGFDRPEDRRLLAGWADQARWGHRLVMVNDGDLVVAAGTPEGWGVGVIAGTGSIAVGRAPDGRTARAGGWGHLIGDEGSAYRVVLDALRMVARRWDGRERRPAGSDPLSDRICSILGVTSPAQMVTTIYAPGFDRARIASLAPEVLAACALAPEIGERLLVPAGVELAEIVGAVARSLEWSSGPLPLAVAGGFLLSATIVQHAMIDNLSRQGYLVHVSSVTEPVRGAIILAERALLAAPTT